MKRKRFNDESCNETGNSALNPKKIKPWRGFKALTSKTSLILSDMRKVVFDLSSVKRSHIYILDLSDGVSSLKSQYCSFSVFEQITESYLKNQLFNVISRSATIASKFAYLK